MDQTLTGDAIEEVAKLAREGAASFQFLQVPDLALNGIETIGTPHVGVKLSADGTPSIVDIKSHIDLYRAKPAFRTGTAIATTLHSFIDLVNRHASADSAVFADANWKAPKLLAVIDYHQRAGNETDTRATAPVGEDEHARNCGHRVSYAFPLSEPWKVWVANDGKFMGQAEFAEFLEDHIHELAAPDPQRAEQTDWVDRFKMSIATPAEIIDLARGLDIKVGVAVKNKVRLQSGETQFVFETEHRDASGQELRVPGLFILAVPIFYLGEVISLPVRLRYRVVEGKIVWAYQMHRPDEAVSNTVRDDIEQVTGATGLPVYDGAPESRER